MDRTRIKLLLGGLVILSAFAFLFMTGMKNSQRYYYTVSEFQETTNRMGPDEAFRISGRVLPGTIERSVDGLDVAFAIYDPSREDVTMTVAYHGVIPDTFMEDSEVVVEGKMQSETFAAHTLLAKCPSKYEGMTDEDARAAAAADAAEAADGAESKSDSL